MKYNIAIEGTKLPDVLDKLNAQATIQKSQDGQWAHFWYESNLPFEKIVSLLRNSGISSWFLSDGTKKATSNQNFPGLVRIMELETINRCSALLLSNFSFMEPGFLFTFDDYVKNSASSSGILSGNEYYFNSDNPIILEMTRLGAIRKENKDIFLVDVKMAFRGTSDPQSLFQQIMSDIETQGNWYSFFSHSVVQKRGEIAKYKSNWISKSDMRGTVFYTSKV